MCTVTFIPCGNNIYITSNRDEKYGRSCALPPATYAFSSGRLMFPKDADAGGTWIAAHENGQAIVFLNGGFERHTPQPPYRKSRGLVLLDLIDAGDPLRCFEKLSLQGIEPFTAVLFNAGQLFECRWDGGKKHRFELPASMPHIWSSVTLYDKAVIEKRTNWFTRWLQQNEHPSQQRILHFHQFTGDGDARNDLRMNRNGQVCTVSVTSMVIGDEAIEMQYLDLKNANHYTSRLTLAKQMAGRS